MTHVAVERKSVIAGFPCDAALRVGSFPTAA